MTDRLLQLANTRWTAPFVRLLGLPRPRHLRRDHGPYGPQIWQGRALWLGGLDGAADAGLRNWLLAQGARLDGTQTPDVMLLDLRRLTRVARLRTLFEQLQPVLRGLVAGARVLVLAPASAPAAPEAAAAVSAVAGFTRSLAKEIGRRGATANLLYLPEAMDPGALAAALAFFGTHRGAYVSGQALALQAPASPVSPLPQPAFQGRTALVTGAAGGIGAATARRLAADGAHVLCVDVAAARAPLTALAQAIGGTALALDLTAADTPARLVEAVRQRGGLDILVHNAGITRDRTLGRMSAAEWDSVLAVNLHAILAIDAALDAAAALRPGAREICLASISGIAGNAGQTNYAASKAGLIGYVRARAATQQSSGGTVNAVAPGFIETAMTKRMPWMVREAGRRLNALQQGGQPADVAEAIAFLARPDAGAVNGQVLRVCGQSLLGA